MISLRNTAKFLESTTESRRVVEDLPRRTVQTAILPGSAGKTTSFMEPLEGSGTRPMRQASLGRTALL